MEDGPDARVLSYHDVLLRKSDVQLLQPGQWLNDQARLGQGLGLRHATGTALSACHWAGMLQRRC